MQISNTSNKDHFSLQQKRFINLPRCYNHFEMPLALTESNKTLQGHLVSLLTQIF